MDRFEFGGNLTAEITHKKIHRFGSFARREAKMIESQGKWSSLMSPRLFWIHA